jgi:protein-S-isoprenylcysteine O-methyltransferase Ste14
MSSSSFVVFFVFFFFNFFSGIKKVVKVVSSNPSSSFINHAVSALFLLIATSAFSPRGGSPRAIVDVNVLLLLLLLLLSHSTTPTERGQTMGEKKRKVTTVEFF